MESFVLVTSPAGVLFATDVVDTPTTSHQRLQPEPAPLAEPTWAFGWAADTALGNAYRDQVPREVWLIMGGVVTDHFSW